MSRDLNKGSILYIIIINKVVSAAIVMEMEFIYDIECVAVSATT